MSDKAILYDSSRCSACRGCQVTCKAWNNLPSPTHKDGLAFTGSYQSPLNLNGDTRLLISFSEEEGGSKGVMWAFGRRSCQHCTDAACATVCPTGAIHIHTETGLVTVDDSLCIGCRYCSTACPYDVPRYYGPESKINKCTGCIDRIEQGRTPACVTTCQPGALKFGDREEMLAIAQERVRLLRTKGYENASVYGETEMGGLHVIQVLKYGTTAHGQVENPQVNPLVQLTELWRPLAGLAAGATVLGLGVSLLSGRGYHRDTLRYDEKTGDTIDVDTSEIVAHKDREKDGE